MARRNSKRNAFRIPQPHRLETLSNHTISREIKDNDDPKTSEWAYFKKLKTEARNIEGPSITKSTRKSSCSEDARPLVHAKSVTPSNFCKSPHGNPSKFSVKKHKGSSTNFEDICHGYISTGECSTTMRNGGNEDKHGDIFSRKRQKLLRWVADTSFPEIDKCDSERCNLVPKLFSRLFPDTTEDNDFWTSKLEKVERNTQHMSARNISVVESSRYLDYDLPWSDRPRGVVISNSAYHDRWTHKHNYDCGFSFTKYDFPLLEFCGELDDYHDRIDSGRLLTLDDEFKADCTNGLSESSYSSVLYNNRTPSLISFTPSHLAINQRYDYDIGKHIFEDNEDWNFAINISNYHDFSSSHFSKPGCPLLLENPYWDGSEDDR